MPRPQAKKYAEIDNENYVVNLIASSESVAKERGYIRASDEVQIADRYDKGLNAFVRDEVIIDEETGETIYRKQIFPVPVN